MPQPLPEAILRKVLKLDSRVTVSLWESPMDRSKTIQIRVPDSVLYSHMHEHGILPLACDAYIEGLRALGRSRRNPWLARYGRRK